MKNTIFFNSIKMDLLKGKKQVFMFYNEVDNE